LETKKYNADSAVENYGDFTASDALNLSEQKKINAENAVANYGDFSYKNQELLDDILNQRMNREKFSYDLNGDALYQQYKDKYINQGRMAMQDTIGQASAMTGGYGNSYAATAGNQAYQASLQNLNDIVPQLYQMALDQYNQETQDLNDKYSLLSNDRSNEYGMWGDKRNALVADRDYYGNDYENTFQREYGMYTDKYGRLKDLASLADSNYTNQYNREYGQHSDAEAYAYKAARDAVADAQWQKSFNQAAAKVSSGGGDKNDTEEDIKVKPIQSENTNTFKATIRTKSEFNRGNNIDKKTYGTYDQYVAGMILKYVDNGTLTEGEAMWLSNYYNLT
jgi:hypothetical protein